MTNSHVKSFHGKGVINLPGTSYFTLGLIAVCFAGTSIGPLSPYDNVKRLISDHT